MADVLSNVSGCLGKGILSGHHIIDGALDFGALSFELGFLVTTVTVLVASSLV